MKHRESLPEWGSSWKTEIPFVFSPEFPSRLCADRAPRRSVAPAAPGRWESQPREPHEDPHARAQGRKLGSLPIIPRF